MEEGKCDLHEVNEQFLCFDDIKEGKINKFPREKLMGKRSYSWIPQESFLYLAYLKTFSKELEIPIMGKYLKFFTRMGKLIKTRTSHQIKSHHQKMMIKYRSLEMVMQHIEIGLSFAMIDSNDTFQTIKKLDEQVRTFLKKERQTVNELFRFYALRIEKEGLLTRELEDKLIEIIPDLPRSSNVKIQQAEDSYKYYDTFKCLDTGDSKTLCKCQLAE